jgi:hypothetical protein
VAWPIRGLGLRQLVPVLTSPASPRASSSSLLSGRPQPVPHFNRGFLSGPGLEAPGGSLEAPRLTSVQQPTQAQGSHLSSSLPIFTYTGNFSPLSSHCRPNYGGLSKANCVQSLNPPGIQEELWLLSDLPLSSTQGSAMRDAQTPHIGL